MSFFKKALASVGIGSLKVDTIFDKEQVQAGEQITGKVYLKSGNVDQNINKIEIRLYAHVYIKDEDTENNRAHQEIELWRYAIADSFTIKKEVDEVFEFDLKLPNDVPVSFGDSKVYMKTLVYIDNAIDKSDRDDLLIAPHPLQEQCMHAFEELGLYLAETEFERAGYGIPTELPVVQELEFKPNGGHFRGKLDELEVMFVAAEDKLYVLLEIDKRGNWLQEMAGYDERNFKLVLHMSEHYSQQKLVEMFYQIITENI
ncbi:sporulation protein [Flammeovirga sp. SubArs3]|uniref:sporulation protein n=1 Tax=Flammeovirga sp. SubArs3 TaxID=2995316 RepID=UPI00248B55F7|nr:sporulation protein [Flammeovirga sp. SubArs3]